MEVLAVFTLVTFMMDFASAKYIIQGNSKYNGPHRIPINEQNIDEDLQKGQKFPPKRPPPWSNSHSPVHNPQPILVNVLHQNTATTMGAALHPASHPADHSTTKTTLQEQTTMNFNGMASFSEWKITWMRNHTSSCGRQHFAPHGTHYRIMGGTDARKGSWPWMVSIYFVPFHQSVCGGFLIDNAWFLTAAHCFDPPLHDAYKFMLIRTGIHNVSSSLTGNPVEQQRMIQKIYTHPGYGTNSTPFDNDIALVKLNHAIETTEFVRPLCLPSEIDTIENDCVITGWGIKRTPNVSSLYEIDSTAWPDLLQQASIPIIEEKECQQKEGYDEKLTENMVCAGYPEGHVDSCNGDSGGPLQCHADGVWRVKGITSWGGKTYSECAQADQPGVYTNVQKYRQWILETIYKDSTLLQRVDTRNNVQ